MPAEEYTECAYCNAEVASEFDIVPEIDDDEAWRELAQYHSTQCEWVLTRAHRVNLLILADQ